MKSTCQLIILGLLIHSFSFGQSVTNYGPFPKLSDDVYNFNYLTESYVLLEKSSHANTDNGDKKRVSYHTFDLQPNATMLSKKMNISSGAKSGVILASFLTDSYIIEFVGFMVVFNPNIDIGIVKRDRKTLEMVGEIKILDEKLHFLDHHSNIIETSNGYVFTRKVEDRYVVSYLDAEFRELKKIPLQEGMSLASFQVTEHDELFALSFKFEKNNSYSYHFSVINPNGEVNDFDPELDLIGSSFGVRNQKITYLPDSEQIEGIFQYSMAQDVKDYDAAKKEEGYRYYRWDLTGKILESKAHVFTVDEVYGEYKKDLLKKFTEKNLSDDLNSMQSITKMVSSGDGNYLIINRLSFLAPMQHSFHIVKLDKNGDFRWSKTLPASMQNSVFNFYATKDGNLRMLLEDANSTISNGKHEVDLMKKANPEEASFFSILIDKNTGELLENNLIDLNLTGGAKIKKITLNEKLNSYLIESIQNKTLTFSVVNY